MVLVLIDSKPGWECYMKGWICNHSTEVFGILLVHYSSNVASYTSEFKYQSIPLQPKVVCMMSYLNTFCFVASVFVYFYSSIFQAVGCIVVQCCIRLAVLHYGTFVLPLMLAYGREQAFPCTNRFLCNYIWELLFLGFCRHSAVVMVYEGMLCRGFTIC